MRTEPKRGAGGGPGKDDTALNAIEVLCVNSQGAESNFPTSHPGWWGDWGAWASCPGQSEPFIGASLLLEPPQGGGKDEDDTAANAVKFICKNGQDIEAPHNTAWGNWQPADDYEKCPAGQAICGLRVKIEPQQGHDKDDTALNGVRFACCKLPE